MFVLVISEPLINRATQIINIRHTIPYFQWIENRAKKALFVICLSQESFFCLSKRNLIRDISLKVIWQWKDFDRWSNSEKQLYVIEYWLNKFYTVLHEMKCTYIRIHTRIFLDVLNIRQLASHKAAHVYFYVDCR